MDLRTDDAILTTLGSRTARHRIGNSLTQEAVAEQAGLSKRTVERIEAGESVQLVSLIRTLRVLDLLGNFDLLIPEPKVSPIELLEQQGRQRQRASSNQSEPVENKPSEWNWDEQL